MRYAMHLEELYKAGVIRDYNLQPKKRLGVPENVYIPDFHVIPDAGPAYYVDVKGFETQTFKKNKRLWKAYGRAALVIVKETSPNKFKVVEEIMPSCSSDNS